MWYLQACWITSVHIIFSWWFHAKTYRTTQLRTKCVFDIIVLLTLRPALGLCYRALNGLKDDTLTCFLPSQAHKLLNTLLSDSQWDFIECLWETSGTNLDNTVTGEQRPKNQESFFYSNLMKFDLRACAALKDLQYIDQDIRTFWNPDWAPCNSIRRFRHKHVGYVKWTWMNLAWTAAPYIICAYEHGEDIFNVPWHPVEK